MKYIFTLIIFSFAGTVIWTIVNYSIQIEDLKERKIEIEQNRLNNGRLINDAYDEIMFKRKDSEQNTITDNSSSQQNDFDENTSKASLNTKTHNNDLPSTEVYDQEQENVVVANLSANESRSLKEFSPITPKQVLEYKKVVLAKIFSSKTSKDLNNTIDKIETGHEKETLIDKAIPATATSQIQSNTFVENVPQDFNFSKEMKIHLNLSSKTASGQTLPNTRLTIENSQGKILLEGSTDIKGKFQEDVTIFTGDKIYVRYYGIGISQEKIEIE